jgi:PAS domain S-box-containing protein
MKLTIEKKVSYGFWLALVILSLVNGFSYWSITRFISTADKVRNSQTVLRDLENLMSLLKDAETGQRGYIITGEERYLEPYLQATVEIERQTKALQHLLRDRFEQQQRFNKLEPLIAKRFDIIEENIALRRTQGFEAAQRLVLTGKGQETMDRIRQIVREMEAQEEQQLQQRSQEDRANAHSTILVEFFGSVMAIALTATAILKINRDITKREQIQAALRESEECFRSAFDNAAIGMGMVALDGRWLKVNPYLCEMLGYCEQELLATTFQSITHPDDLETNLNYVHQLLSGEIRSYQMEKRYFHSSGHVIWILLTCSLVRDTQGHPLYFIGQVQDISERQAVLREREQAQRTLELQSVIVKNMAGGVCLVRAADAVIAYANPKFERMFGYEPGELNGKPVHILNYKNAHKSGEQIAVEIMSQIDERGEVVYEVHNVKKDGTCFWCRAHTSTFEHPEYGTVYVAVQEDITEHKRAQAALSLLAAIVESSDSAIISKTLDGVVVSWNAGAQRLFGYSAQQAIGQSICFLIPPDRLDEQRQILEKVNRGESIEHYETVRRRKDGTLIDISLTISPVRDETGKIIGASKIADDISDRKLAEEKIKASLREKEVLLAEIHHRVKNNLHIISNLLYLQANRSKDDKAREILQNSRNRVDSMALIHESLYRAQDFAEINLNEYVQKLSANLFSIYKIPADAITFKINAKTNILINLEQAIPCGLIVNELITNALKHGLQNHQEGEVFVTLECSPERQLLLAVGNSGHTLPADFNLQNPQSMGLKLVVTLVKQLKGAIELERGNTTVFRIKFAASV